MKRNGATVLTILGSIGLVATAVLTAMETPKAIGLITEEENKKGDKLTKIETTVVVAKAYMPAITVGFSSIACILGANVLNKKTQASLMSAYSFADRMYKE